MFADNRKELQELIGGCKDLQKPVRSYKGLQGFANDCKDLQKLVRSCKRLQEFTDERKDPQSAHKTTSTTAKTMKRIGAIQVFCPRPSKAGDLATGKYRMSRKADSFSFIQDPYFRRPRTFRVATAYKTKANKVRPVDSSDVDGSKPGGCMDWFERSKADDIPYLDSRQYSD
jgi:hypothetical protein